MGGPAAAMAGLTAATATASVAALTIAVAQVGTAVSVAALLTLATAVDTTASGGRGYTAAFLVAAVTAGAVALVLAARRPHLATAD